MVIIFLVFWRNFILFSQVYRFTFLPAMTISSYPLQHFAFVFVCVVCFPNSSHSNWWASLKAQLVKNLPPMQWLRKIPRRRDRLPTPVFWPGEFHGLSMGLQRVGHDWATFTSPHSSWYEVIFYCDFDFQMTWLLICSYLFYLMALWLWWNVYSLF